MRVFIILAALVLLGLNGALLLPQAIPYQFPLMVAAAGVALLLLLALLAARGHRSAPAAPKAEAARPAAVPAANQAEAEVVSFLAILQEKGRLVDFLMDDITSYSDAQVGAAARVVHQGCRAALQEHLSVVPVCAEAEGSKVSVPADHAADEYRLTGRIAGQAPFTGILVHRGWRTERVKLPRVLRPAGDRLPSIAPAEVDLT